MKQQEIHHCTFTCEINSKPSFDNTPTIMDPNNDMVNHISNIQIDHSYSQSSQIEDSINFIQNHTILDQCIQHSTIIGKFFNRINRNDIITISKVISQCTLNIKIV